MIAIDYARVWTVLLDNGCRHAAAGLLADAFARSDAGGQVDEALAALVGDDGSGRVLEEWRATFAADPAAFADVAEQWVADCRAAA